jgi:hypothetical protein
VRPVSKVLLLALVAALCGCASREPRVPPTIVEFNYEYLRPQFQGRVEAGKIDPNCLQIGLTSNPLEQRSASMPRNDDPKKAHIPPRPLPPPAPPRPPGQSKSATIAECLTNAP